MNFHRGRAAAVKESASARRRAFCRPWVILFAAFIVFMPGAAHAAQVVYSTPPIASWKVNGQGWAVQLVGDVAYVGGDFPTALPPTGVAVPRLDMAAFNVQTGALVSEFVADTNGSVKALATDGTKLFIGGKFTTINGVARTNLAAVDLAKGTVIPTWEANATGGTVWSLDYAAGTLYVGGAFTKLDGATRLRTGAVTANGAVTAWAPSINNQIRAIAADPVSGVVYAGGRQTTVNGEPSTYLSKINAAGVLMQVTFPKVTEFGQGLDLSADGTRLAVAQAKNETGWYDTSSGVRLWDQNCGGNGQAVKVIEDSVISGFHDQCDTVLGRDLMINAQATGARNPNFLPVLNLFWGVRAIDGNADYLVIGGNFTNIDGRAVKGFAIFHTP